MKQQRTPSDIYQLRIVLRGISPLIWRRLLVRSDTTLAQLHLMLQILFAWSNEHLHHFHIFGKDYGSDGAETRDVMLRSFGFQRGERFRYVYNYYAQWQCDIRLEATLPCEPQRFYPVCTGGQRPAPPEHVHDAWLYAAGLAAVDIAHLLDVHPNTIYADLHAFGHDGIAAIHQVSRGGAPQEITPAQEAEIQRLAELPPYTLGLPYGRWSLAKLRAYLIQQHVLKTISREHLRRVLKKGGCTVVGSSANCSALIPNVAPF